MTEAREAILVTLIRIPGSELPTLIGGPFGSNLKAPPSIRLRGQSTRYPFFNIGEYYSCSGRLVIAPSRRLIE